jgi:hypothetical protein
MLIAEQLGDVWSIACSLAGEILVSSVVAPKKSVDLEPIVERAVKAASETNDAYLQYLIRYVIAFEEMHCGRMEKARTSAEELMEIGRRL